MNILVNYANQKYRETQKLNTWTGKHIAGFDIVYEFGPDDIDAAYQERHQDILSVERGNGLWLWKPYFILKVLEEANEGDKIFYCDSGAFFIRSIRPVLDILDRETIFVTDFPLLEVNFTKKSCFEKMSCDTEDFLFSNQIAATYLALRCCEASKKFVREWLSLCEDFGLISPENNEAIADNDRLQFISHREDQSILSLLCKEKGIKPHRDISHRGKRPYTFFNSLYEFREPEHSDQYHSLVFLHKMPKLKLAGLVKYCIRCFLKRKEYKRSIAGIRD